MSKVLLIAGHGAGDNGAVANGNIERDYIEHFIKVLTTTEMCDYDIYPLTRNFYFDVGNDEVQVNILQYDAVFEIHFNSFSSEIPSGFEFVTIDNYTALHVDIYDAFKDVGFLTRPIKNYNFQNLRYANNLKFENYYYFEICFLSNKSDMLRYQDVAGTLAENIDMVTWQYFNNVITTPETIEEKISQCMKLLEEIQSMI